MKLKVKTNSSSSVLVGPLFGSSGTGPVTVGNTAAPVAAPAPVAPKKSEPMLNDTESYFNKAIKDAVAKGDVDKALKLLDEGRTSGIDICPFHLYQQCKRQGVIVSPQC
ncbi:maltose operon periplasmic protein [Salmonella enterica subsp. enterica]|uniref:Maltose operon periplasmic protein n=1 Tax=Salmonella enterica I TaxID=59201 RepID=A0A447PWZ9_SALET|nr:maltose operon periplasmic protein [Salmonella enterica subsp. enterica]